MCVCTDACVCVLTRVCDVLQVNRTVYTYRQDYAPNTKDGRYSFIVSPLTVKAQWCTVRGVFSVLQLTCTHRVLQNTYAYLMCLCMHVCLILFLPPSLIPPPPPPGHLSSSAIFSAVLHHNVDKELQLGCHASRVPSERDHAQASVDRGWSPGGTAPGHATVLGTTLN